MFGNVCIAVVTPGVAAGVWWIEARDAAQPPAVPRTAAPDKGAEVEQRCSSFCLREGRLKVMS